MSREYDLYLQEHKENVAKGFYWIRENLYDLIPRDDGIDYEHLICYEHDKSKSEADEYYAYDRYFYGTSRSFEVVEDFNYAWLQHIHRNPHHWQHWVLINDDPNEGEKIIDMPYHYILEMVCDWWAFSWKADNLREIFNWYDKHEKYMKLSKKTRGEVEKILEQIKEKLDELELKKDVYENIQGEM